MSGGQADAKKWWFCFRQAFSLPGGKWTTEGPFDTYDEAMAARTASKQWDAQFGNVFNATAAEAQEDCAAGRTH